MYKLKIHSRENKEEMALNFIQDCSFVYMKLNENVLVDSLEFTLLTLRPALRKGASLVKT